MNYSWPPQPVRTFAATIDQTPPSLDVLVADESADVRAGLEFCLRRLDHRVRCAATGIEAMALLHRKYFDLMVVDTLLPDGAGLDVIAEAKRRYPSTRVLVMNDRRNAVSLAHGSVTIGAHPAIAKPFTAEEFLNALREMMVDSD